MSNHWITKLSKHFNLVIIIKKITNAINKISSTEV